MGGEKIALESRSRPAPPYPASHIPHPVPHPTSHIPRPTSYVLRPASYDLRPLPSRHWRRVPNAPAAHRPPVPRRPSSRWLRQSLVRSPNTHHLLGAAPLATNPLESPVSPPQGCAGCGPQSNWEKAAQPVIGFFSSIRRRRDAYCDEKERLRGAPAALAVVVDQATKLLVVG